MIMSFRAASDLVIISDVSAARNLQFGAVSR